MECHILCVIVYIIKIDRPRWLIPFGCGSKLRGAGHESRPGRMLVIGVLNIQCFKLFKGVECAVMSMVLCTIKKTLKSFVSTPGFLLSRYCHDCTESEKRKAIFIHSHNLGCEFESRHSHLTGHIPDQHMPGPLIPP